MVTCIYDSDIVDTSFTYEHPLSPDDLFKSENSGCGICQLFRIPRRFPLKIFMTESRLEGELPLSVQGCVLLRLEVDSVLKESASV
jgi:hypothetical protein